MYKKVLEPEIRLQKNVEGFWNFVSGHICVSLNICWILILMQYI